jgi:3-phosphoshikimate 1-carboxyvinyltransferase
MLPKLIEIIPPVVPPVQRIVIPGSKSITNRALVLAALADGPVELRGALWSEDTQVMTDCLRRLGYKVAVAPDPGEPANRTLRVVGLGGRVPAGGTEEAPLSLEVANAGTAARFLTAMVCLGSGCYRLSGIPRMHERPQAALLVALRGLGYRIDAEGDHLPAVVHGGGPKPGAVARVSVAESSQFASALLLASGVGGWEIGIEGANPDELPYVEMTRRMVADFPWQGGVYQIEPDASSASYFWGAQHLLAPLGTAITVADPPVSGMQADAAFAGLFLGESWRRQYSRQSDLADSIMTAIALAPFAPAPVDFTDLGRLRVQECERVLALRTELGKCGADVRESGDTLTVAPGPLHGAEIATWNDHRMAMCFGMLGLRVPGIRLQHPGCVRKTFPNFFAKLAQLGAEIRGADGQVLSGDDLLAD